MKVRWRSQFKKDYHRMLTRGRDIAKLDDVIGRLSAPDRLPERYRDHPLSGGYQGYRDCHIEPDWVLIYGYETLDSGARQLLLVRTGSHSDLLE